MTPWMLAGTGKCCERTLPIYIYIYIYICFFSSFSFSLSLSLSLSQTSTTLSAYALCFLLLNAARIRYVHMMWCRWRMLIRPEWVDGELVTTCSKCKTYKPQFAHHCSTCGRCVRRMDHHCPWVNNCVGENNQKHFIRFTLYIFFTCFLVRNYNSSLWLITIHIFSRT